jgi:hypothetical protein
LGKTPPALLYERGELHLSPSQKEIRGWRRGRELQGVKVADNVAVTAPEVLVLPKMIE